MLKPDSDIIKRISTRPISAPKLFPTSKSGTLLKAKRPALPDAVTMARLKPKHIALDKERLYEETLALKMEANYFREENVRLKTRMKQLERELDRRNETLDDFRSTAKERYFPSTLYSTHLVSNLKSTIKDLRNELKAKEEQTQKAKRDFRTSRISELEIELRVYVDECSRLKHHLEEVMRTLARQKEEGWEMQENEGKRILQEEVKARTEDCEHAKGRILELEVTLKDANSREKELNEQIKTLKSQYEKRCESQRKASIVEESQLIAALAQARQQLLASSEHTQTLEIQVKQLTSALKSAEIRLNQQSKGSLKFSVALRKASSDEGESREITPAKEKSTNVEFVEKCSDILSVAPIEKRKIVKSVLSAGTVAANDLLIALQAAEVETSLAETQAAAEQPAILKDLLEIVQTPARTQTASLNPSGNGTFRVKEDVEHRVAPYFPEYKTPAEVSIERAMPLPILPESTAKALKALEFRLQLHRIPKTKLTSALFSRFIGSERAISREEFAKQLAEPPFNFTSAEEVDLIVKFALDGEQVTAKDVANRLFTALEDWEVFTPADEAEFDRHISEVLSPVKSQFSEACSKRDPSSTGLITIPALKEICEELQFGFNSREYHYMELLFFSLNFTLNQVPFSKLIQAYAEDSSSIDSATRKPGNEESMDESEKKRIITGYMELISNELMRKSLDLRQVFHSKEGILYPDKLVAGMRTLGIPDMEDREMIVFLEALQCEDLDEYGIEMSLLEDIIQGYKESEGLRESSGHSV